MIMAQFKVHGGDFGKGNGQYLFGGLSLPGFNSIRATELESVEILTEESIKKLGRTIGGGLIGRALLGPVGLLAGVLASGRKREITFIAKLKDGRQFIATAYIDTFVKLKGASTPAMDFAARTTPEGEISLDQETKKCPQCAETIKLEAKKCRYCGEILDPKEVENIVSAHLAPLEEERARLTEEMTRRAEGQAYCPGCDRWDKYPHAALGDGSIGPWCPHCQQPAKDSNRRCPRCEQWDILTTIALPDGRYILWCPHCKKPVPK